MRNSARELREGIVAVLKKTAVDGARGRGVSDLRRNAPGEIEAAAKATIWFPELREGRNQHAEGIVLFPRVSKPGSPDRDGHSPSETIFMRSNLHLGSSWTAPSFL